MPRARRRAATAAASSGERTSAKTVEPEPVIAAASGFSVRRAASVAAISGWSAAAAGSRSLASAAVSAARSPRRIASAASVVGAQLRGGEGRQRENTSRVEEWTPGNASTRLSGIAGSGETIAENTKAAWNAKVMLRKAQTEK